MNIGTLKEIKNHEYRVGLTPACAGAYVRRGHQVCIEKGAGISTGFGDEEYVANGATIIESRKKLCDACEMIVKVKEPLAEEYDLFHEGQILYTFLHLAASEELTNALLKRKVKAVAYETIETDDGDLPCLRPMSEIAGRLSIQEGAKYLEKTFGGRGVLLGGVPGIQRGKVAILGGGVAGINACKIAVGMGADVTVLDIDFSRLAYLDDIFGSSITTLYSNDANIDVVLAESDLIIGAVLKPGAKTPKLIKKDKLSLMKNGAVVVDIAVDQGGCFETTRPTTHDDPIYLVENIVHYCVGNMPGAVPLSSTISLVNTTQIFGLMIADSGLENACRISPALRRGINLYMGNCVYENLSHSLGVDFTSIDGVLNL